MKYKSLMTGIIIGATIATSISVFANSNLNIEALLVDATTTIKVDGVAIKLPSDSHILNYDGKIYTPAKLVAEQLGASVTWNDPTKSVLIETQVVKPIQTVKPSTTSDIGVIKTPNTTTGSQIGVIKSAEPTIKPTVTPIETETPTVTPTQTSTATFSDAPLKLVKNGITFNVYKFERTSDFTRITLDLENENMDYTFLDYKNAYIEIDGSKYTAVNNITSIFNNSINSYDSLSGEYIDFERTPENVDEMKIVIPVQIGSNSDRFEAVFNIRF